LPTANPLPTDPMLPRICVKINYPAFSHQDTLLDFIVPQEKPNTKETDEKQKILYEN
jgi:hypothetical protein